ncbi:MAG: InlB B-repeat-containing protein [Fibrobacter sp.]|nr:InlB B-repeat-containing protein [Fibrobacter sp.]
MKTKIGLFLFTMLAYGGMGFALPGDETPASYYNLFTFVQAQPQIFGSTTTVVLSQGPKPCTSTDWTLEYNGQEYTADASHNIGYYITTYNMGMGFMGSQPVKSFKAVGECLASVEDTPANLASMLDEFWVSAEGKKGVPLELWSNIDLKEFAADTKVGECKVNHVPLPMMDSTSFNGNGFTIKHLCYAATVSDKSPMQSPVGFFKKAENVSLTNVNINGVRIYIDGESTDGADYYPVGAFVGAVNMVTIDGVTLANDSIQAPFAGGLVGLVRNSTLKRISGDDDIYITNKTSIASGYAGSKEMSQVPEHKVFLGGIAGVAIRTEHEEDPIFIDDSVKVEVHDYATGHRSALGGIAGFYQTIGGTDENLKVFTKYKNGGEVVATKISGGSSMGGLFGALYVPRDYNSASAGNFVTTNSSFDGKIYDAASTGVIAVGGIVGYDSIGPGTSVRITNSVSNIDVADSLKVAGKYQYYAGGIVGYGSSCVQGSNNGKDLLSVTGVRTTGSIALSASGTEVPGLHSDAYLGGVVGSACLAQAKDFGLANDTSSVKITSKVKTALDAGKTSNNAPSRDTVYVGGVIGFASIAVASKSATLSNLYYNGSIVVEDSLNNVFVGGILGGFTKAEGGKSLVFEEVYANNSKLISYRAMEAGAVSTTNPQVANIGGVCGVCNEISLMNRVAVLGEISVIGNHAGNSLFVGGLVGLSDANEVKMNLRNIYSIGDILATANNAYDKSVGYLVGKAQLNKGYRIKSIYHYGEGDAMYASKPFGYLNTDVITNGWLNDDSISYVIRSGDKSSYSENQKNGTELTSTMKSSKFAGILNAAYSDAEDYAWNFAKGTNNDLPFFVADGDDPVDPVVPGVTKYIVTFVDMNGERIKQESVVEHGSATAPLASEMPKIEGYTFSGKWEKQFDDIVDDITVPAIYDINSYTVKFFDYDDRPLKDVQTVKYLESAVAPDDPERTGYTFAGWDDSTYVKVTKNLTVHAKYSPNKYWIEFKDYDGHRIWADSVFYDSPVSKPVDIKRAPTPEYRYEFKGWTPEVTKVKGDAVYTAVYDSAKIKYEVVFVDEDGTQIGEIQLVEYGAAAVAPEAPVHKGYTFVRWVPAKFDNITSNTVVNALYEKIPESSSSEASSSSVEISSSSEPESSSSVEESSSSEEIASSSSSSRNDEVSSSSSIPVVSSSSIRGEIKIVKPTIKKSGNNAIRLTFGTENVDESAVARVFVICEKDTVWKDSIQNLIVGNGEWELVPAPIGKFKVVLTVDDKVRHAVYVDSFEVASEIKAAPGSWQMISLSAFDKKKVKADDALFYWWDEKNPVGDYWQYRAFNGEKTDATRGFWYGTTEGNPLVIRESTGSKDSEIVWELDSLYSGWNLVANPYGWNVNLTKGAADNDAQVTFWRWNPTTGNYDPKPKVIGPYEAVWAKVTKSTTWRMSAAPEFKIEAVSAAETKTAMHKDAADVKGAWSLMVSLADDYGRQDSWNVIGAGAEESLDEPPAGMGNRVSLAIRNSEKGAKLAKSIKAVADEYSWILDVSASSMRDGKLKFEGIKELNSQGLKLFVTADGVTTEITNEKSMNVALAKSAKQVEVRVAAGNAVVASSKISGFGSTLAGGTLQVGFTAPDALAGARASYAVVGVDGKKVASGSFKATSGTNQFSLKAPKTGVYFVKIKVGSQQLSGKVLVK